MYIFGFTRAVNLPRSVRRVSRSAAVALAAIAVAAVVASCAAPGGPRSDDLVCNSPQQCRVTVRVDCNPGCTASVDHPQVVSDYRAARSISDANPRGEADTDQLREAMLHFTPLTRM